MTRFENMTEDQQKSWWMEQAKSILDRHEMIGADLSWLAYTHNAVFDVVHDQKHKILRLQPRKTAPNLQGEVAILKRLNESQLAAPVPEWTYETGEVCAVLLGYVAGVSYTPETITESAMQAIGAYLANLHALECHVQDRPRLDYAGLFSKSGIYYPGDDAMRSFTVEQITVMDSVAAKVFTAMDKLGTSNAEFGIIHGDFLLKNILFHDAEVRALDFEYCGWGYYLYDLTPILWQLKPHPHYQLLEAALWNGYTSMRSMTEVHHTLLETFIAGRQVASMRWLAANRHNPAYYDKVETIMNQRSAELQGFLETGILTRSN